MRPPAELWLAVVLDVCFSEPPAPLHPVVWMGRLADALERRLPSPDAPQALVAGGGAWAAGLLLVAGGATVAGRAPWPVRGIALWPLVAGRMLVAEVVAVETALHRGGAEAGRAAVARLVSRPTDGLDAGEVRMAAIESLAENLSDSWVAPLAWWALAGLPGAAAYRWINTMDAKWGYRTPEWDRRGRTAACADDLANLLPARLTALLLRGRLDGRLRREARRTASPNAGWPMAAMALALDVRLAKRGAYVLHATGNVPGPAAVAAGVRRALVAGVLAVAVLHAVAARRR